MPFDERGTGVVLEHEAAAIDAGVVLTPAPIGIDLVVFPASAALFDVEMVAFVVQVDGALAPVTPDDSLMRLIEFDLEGHIVKVIA